MKVNDNDSLEVCRFSDEKYEKLSSIIFYMEVPIAQVNKDKGKDKRKIK